MCSTRGIKDRRARAARESTRFAAPLLAISDTVAMRRFAVRACAKLERQPGAKLKRPRISHRGDLIERWQRARRICAAAKVCISRHRVRPIRHVESFGKDFELDVVSDGNCTTNPEV